ncbi:MAG: GNAT family N-acetyltransferase, partial [Myxococcales bacterium]|nr:GNAT family N-acetyltransferase [Myxococcales bacterium]
ARRFGDDDCAVHRLERRVWAKSEGCARGLMTQRLRLRPWREQDLAPFAEINADSEVARYLPSTLSRDESDGFARRIRMNFGRDGLGLWAAERVDLPSRPFIGFIGLAVPSFEAHFTPCVEVGWRLARKHWGVGLATEGARAVVRYAFTELELAELVSFTSVENRASRRVMEKLGMARNPGDDFDHPRLEAGHRLRRHVLYRLQAGQSATDEART